MKASDQIANFIKEMLDIRGECELQRNELALQFSCVPSQINYVISTRFTPEFGFIVESRRGGGGYIRISKIKFTDNNHLMHVINSLGSEIGELASLMMVQNLYNNGLITKKEAKIFKGALGARVYSVIDQRIRDAFRAAVFKDMLLGLM